MNNCVHVIFAWLLTDKTSSAPRADDNSISNVRIKVEPRRLYPAFHFSFNKMTENNAGDPVRTLGYKLIYTAGFREVDTQGQKYIVSRIPFGILKIDTIQP